MKITFEKVTYAMFAAILAPLQIPYVVVFSGCWIYDKTTGSESVDKLEKWLDTSDSGSFKEFAVAMMFPLNLMASVMILTFATRDKPPLPIHHSRVEQVQSTHRESFPRFDLANELEKEQNNKKILDKKPTSGATKVESITTLKSERVK